MYALWHAEVVAVAMNRDAISRRIRALRAKTVENGCTEAEALAAAQLLADLLAKYNMTLDEAELRESPFAHHRERHDDWVGDRLWKVAAAISHLTGARYWVQAPGMPVSIDFFGFEHEVEVARYMLEICANAMRHEKARKEAELWPRIVKRNAMLPFLDGMADRLAQRIRAMKPPQPAGVGLVVLHDALIDAAMPTKTEQRRARSSRDRDSTYVDGWDAGGKVALNRGLRGGSDDVRRLTNP